jgi:hypothetical protein
MKKTILSLGLFLAFSQCLHAQWTTGTANNIYTTTAGNNVVIGGALPFTINASALLFPASIPKMEIITGAVSTAYSDVVTLRHTGLAADLLSRQMGLVFKLSGEGSTVESNKMGGILVESNNGYANNPSMSLLTANARRLTIDFNGNVGIGTTTPAAALSIVSGIPMIQVFDRRSNPADGSIEGKIAFGSAGAAEYASIEVTRVGTSYDDVTAMKFKTSNAVGAGGDGNNIERMRISPSGNVSIGTADSKGYKLAVNGSAIATSMIVKLNSAWPDYVFKKDYQLLPLQEVKAYIDQNQHLPEVPSEQQIAKEGLNLGEMNKLLMKKVEELTLYLIEEHKKNKEQSDANEFLEVNLKKQQQQINQLKEKVELLLSHKDSPAK